jgi:ABC-type uncharacterized transport system fused permease/ATPase subunit
VAQSFTPDRANRVPDSARHLASRFWHNAAGFWRGPSARRAWLLTGLLVGCVMVQLAIQYRLNLWSRDFLDAFGRRDGTGLRAHGRGVRQGLRAGIRPVRDLTSRRRAPLIQVSGARRSRR